MYSWQATITPDVHYIWISWGVTNARHVLIMIIEVSTFEPAKILLFVSLHFKGSLL